MSKYLDFEHERREKDYSKIDPSVGLFKSMVGRVIVWVTSRDVDQRRGYVFPRAGTVAGTRRQSVVFENGEEIRVKDILECGVKDK